MWAIKHPATSYVQGINDLVTPFFVVFLSDHVGTKPTLFLVSCCQSSSLNLFFYLTEDAEQCDVSKVPESVLATIEADCYWCLYSLLDGIQVRIFFGSPKKHLNLKL